MVTTKQALAKYGDPVLERSMVVYDVPSDIEAAIPTAPKKVYCNRDLVKPLEQAFRNLIARGYAKELKTWDGCFNIRKKKGNSSHSLHSWGLAIDVNAAWNGWNKKPTLSEGFVKCFKDAGFDWGGDWTSTPDGMHFQLAKLP